MKPYDLLRFNWKPSLLRLALAVWRDGGPVSEDDWAVRSGVKRNHLLPALREAVRNGLLKCEMMPEGLRLLVQPFEFWTGPDVDELSRRVEWDRAWQVSGQARMALATEEPGLAAALAGVVDGEDPSPWPSPPGGSMEPESGANRNPVGGQTGIRSQPESGLKPESGRVAPESGSARASDRDRSGTREKEITSSRVPDRDRGEPESGLTVDRLYLLNKLRRMHRLEQEILKPQSGFQERMGRLFWELEGADAEWLRGRMGELADRRDIVNKSAWLNKSMTARVAFLRAQRVAKAEVRA